MTQPPVITYPAVAIWRINTMRFLFLLMALIMGSMVWAQLLEGGPTWPIWKGAAKSMLAALALISLLGVRYPLQMLPIMLYEMAWKTVWLTFVALRAWLEGTWNADIQSLFEDCIGIVIAYFVVPWPYIWARYIRQPMEPLFRPK